jgi:hypothetical protein
VNPAAAQFEIVPPKWYPATRYANLFVQMSDTSKAHTRSLMNLIRENWTLTPVTFHIGKAAPSLVVPGNLFLTVSSFTRTIQYIRENWAGRSNYKGTTSTNDWYYMSIEASNNPGSSSKNELDLVARSELYLKSITYGGQDALEAAFKKDLKPSGFIRKKESTFDLADADFKYVYLNGAPGQLKNMIQYINAQLKAGTTTRILDELKTTPELSNLKHDTLYVANYWYGEDWMPMEALERDSKPYKITVKYVDEMIAAYPYKIKLISREALNDMILGAKKDFYYYNYIQSSSTKLVSVINGFTGNLVYSEVTRLKYRPNEKDFEKLGAAIGK